MAFVTIAVAITAMITMVSGTRVFSSESFLTDRKMPSGRADLKVPQECALWRSVANDSAKLHLYVEHFTSHDYSMYAKSFHSVRGEDPPSSFLTSLTPFVRFCSRLVHVCIVLQRAISCELR